MATLRYTQLPDDPIDLGVHLSTPNYCILVTLHLLLHYQLMRHIHADNYRRIRLLSWLLIGSQLLLPFLRGVQLDWTVINIFLSFHCIYFSMRMSIVTERIICHHCVPTLEAEPEDTKKSDGPQLFVLDPRSFTLREYMIALYLDETPAHRPIRISDPFHARIAELPTRYKAWLVRLGWLELPTWIRYLLRPLAYLAILQVPLTTVLQDMAFLTHYIDDPADAARVMQLSRLQAFGRCAVLFYCCVLSLYLTMNFWYCLVFDLLQITINSPARRGLFRQPWLASSPRDLWSRRWNLPTQSTLSEVFYGPSYRLLDAIARQTGCPSAGLSESTHRRNRHLAAMVVFLASALLHEYIIISVLGSYDLFHLRFFCFQGLAVIMYGIYERLICRLVKSRWLAYTLTSFPVGWAFTVWCMAISAHWFFRPFLFKELVDYLSLYALV